MKIIQNRKKLNMICYILIVTMLVSLIPSLGLNRIYAYTEKTGTVHGGTLNIRSGPGTGYGIVGKYSDGAIVNIVGEEVASDGSTWYQVRFKSSGVDTYGYVHSMWITNVQDVIEYTEDADFEAYLTSQGFPESYKDGLRTLHAKYPKWVFVADHIDYTWDYALEGQNYLGRSLISTNSISSWKSLQDGAYNWQKGEWVGFDGSAWVCASKELIAYYMDPRNFLDEESVFQFEMQSYNASIHTIDGLRTLVSGSFLATGSITNDETGTDISYVDAVILAAQKSGVSPYLLASSIIFEMGSNGASNSISGTLEGYTGLYNYYNWGAAAGNGLTAIQNGLLYAGREDAPTLRPWNTRYKALIGGALKYGKDYISQGQDTAYYKKFDYVGTPFTHQYMTHIMGAYLEGSKASKGYSAATKKDTGLVFKIPVFKEMPETVAVCPTGDGSPNNVLSSLGVTGYSITPTFSYYTQNYSLVVENTVQSIDITATVMDSTATVTGTGTIALNEGLNEIKVTVTSQSGSARDYIITVVRKTVDGTEPETPPPTESVVPQISTTLGVNNTDMVINGIATKTDVSALLSMIQVTNGTIALMDKNGSEKTSGIVATGDKVVVKDLQGAVNSEYSVILYGDVNGDGDINLKDAYIVRKYLLSEMSIEGVYLKAGDVNRKADGVDLKDAYIMRKFILGEMSINQQ